MSGMVKAPVVTALAMALPLTVPKSPLEITATLPAPPRVWPATASAVGEEAQRPPCDMTPPKSTNRKMYVAETRVGTPKTPCVVSVCWSTSFRNDSPPWARKPGRGPGRVGHEGQGQDHEGRPDVAARGLQQQHREQHADDDVGARDRPPWPCGPAARCARRSARAEQGRSGGAVEPAPRRPAARAAAPGRVGVGSDREPERDREGHVHRQLDQQVVEPGLRGVELEQRPGPSHPARNGPRLLSPPFRSALLRRKGRPHLG